MSLSIATLNVYPYLSGGTVVNNEGAGGLSSYALSGHTVGATLTAFPSVGSGGTAGVYTPSGSVYIAGFVDGDRAKWFYTDGSTQALPSLKSIAQAQYADTTGTRGGTFTVKLAYAATDTVNVNNPASFVLTESAALIIASTQYG